MIDNDRRLPMIPTEDWETWQAMMKYGGSFVRALAECMACADPINYEKLKATFKEYWREYERVAKQKGNGF